MTVRFVNLMFLTTDLYEMVQFARDNLWCIMQKMFPPKFNLKARLAKEKVWSINMFFNETTQQTYLGVRLDDDFKLKETTPDTNDLNVLKVPWTRFFLDYQLSPLTAWNVGELEISNCVVLIFEGLAQFMYHRKKIQTKTLHPMEWFQTKIQVKFPSNTNHNVDINNGMLLKQSTLKKLIF